MPYLSDEEFWQTVSQPQTQPTQLSDEEFWGAVSTPLPTGADTNPAHQGLPALGYVPTGGMSDAPLTEHFAQYKSLSDTPAYEFINPANAVRMMTEAAQSKLWPAIPAAYPEKIAEMVGAPKGTGANIAVAPTHGLVTSWVPGLVEAAGAIPEGTQQAINADTEKLREESALGANSNLGTNAAFWVPTAAEFVGGATPTFLATRGARLLAEGSKVPQAIKAFAKPIAGAAEGIVQAAGATQGLEGDDRKKALELVAGLSALGFAGEAANHLFSRATIGKIDVTAETPKGSLSETPKVTYEDVSSQLKPLAETPSPTNADIDLGLREMELGSPEFLIDRGDQADILDAQYRRAIEADKDTSVESRTPADAVSQLRDAVAAVIQKRTDENPERYSKLFQRGVLPKDETGAQISFEEFNRRSLKNQSDYIDKAMQSRLGKSGLQDVDAIDNVASRILRKYKVRPEDVGFRGDLYAIPGDELGKALDWLRTNAPKSGVASLSPEKMLELTNRAIAEGVDQQTIATLVSAEAEKAANKVKPQVGVSDILDDFNKAASEILSDIPVDGEGKVLANIPWNRPDGVKKVFPKVWNFIKHEASSSAYNLRDYLLGLPTDIAKQMQIASDSFEKLGDIVGARVMLRFHTALKDLDTAVSEYRKRVLSSGEKAPDNSAVMERMFTAYESKDYKSVGDPELAGFLENRLAPFMNEMSGMVAQLVRDEGVRKAIEANMGSYLFRRYGFFVDPENYWRKLRTDSKPYQDLRQAIKTGNTAKYKIEFEKNYGHLLTENGMTREEAAAYLDRFIDARVTGDLESIIFKHARVPGSSAQISKEIPGIRAEYLLDRVLNDPNVKAILGQEKKIDVVLEAFGNQLAGDVAAYGYRYGMVEAFRRKGLIRTAAEEAAGNVRQKVHTDTLTKYDPTSDGAPKSLNYYYVHPVVEAIFKGVRRSSSDTALAIGGALSLVKANMITSIPNAVQNYASYFQGVLAGYGLINGTTRLVISPMETARAFQIAMELRSPGTKGASSAALQKLGFLSKDEVRAAVEALVAHGLDDAGEFAKTFKDVNRALLIGAESTRGVLSKSLELGSKGSQLAFKALSIPDVATKVFVYRANLSELMHKAGTGVETEAMIKDAVKRTRDMTQTPDQTPNIVKHLSGRGHKSGLGAALSAATAGFQNFMYQSIKIHTNAIVYGAKDLVEAATNPNLTAKQRGLYAWYGANRTAGALFSSYLYWEMMRKAFFEKDKEKTEAVQHFLFKDQENGRIFGGHPFWLNLDHEDRTMLQWKNGRLLYNYVDAGMSDLAEPFYRTQGLFAAAALEAAKVATGDGDPHLVKKYVVDALNEYQDMFFSPGVTAQPTFTALGYRFNDSAGDDILSRLMPVQRETLPSNRYVKADRAETSIVGPVTVEGLTTAVRQVIPALARTAGDIAIGVGHEKGLWSAERLGPQSHTLKNPLETQIYRQATSLSVQQVDAAAKINRKFNSDWGKNHIWLDRALSSWKANVSVDARMKILQENREKWDKLMATIGGNYGALHTQGLNGIEIEFLTNDREEVPNVVPKIVRNSFLNSGTPPTLEEYLFDAESRSRS